MVIWKWLAALWCLCFSLSSQAQYLKKTYSSEITYGEIKDVLQKQFFDLEEELFSELERAYRSKCQNRTYRSPSKFHEVLDLEKHIQCPLDLQSLYQGRLSIKNVLRGRLKSSDFPEIKLKNQRVFEVTNSPVFSVDFQLKTEPFKTTLLDFKKSAWNRNHGRLFSSFTLQHTPLYRSSAQYMCLNLPGMKISTNMGDLSLEDASQSGRTLVSMNLGGLEFDRILMCGVLSLKHSKDYTPLKTGSGIKTSFKKLNVKYVNIRAYGPRILRIHSQRRKMKDVQPYNLSQQLKKSVSQAASKNISGMVSRQLHYSMNKKQRNLSSGELWKTLYNKSFHHIHSPLASVMFNEMRSNVISALTPKHGNLEKVFDNTCAEAQEYMGSLSGRKVSCDQAIAEAVYHGFDPESSSRRSGCYEHSFEVVESPYFLELPENSRYKSTAAEPGRIPGNQWWTDDCIFSTTQSMMVHRDYEQALNCVAETIQSNPDGMDIDQHCLRAFLAPPAFDPFKYRTRRYPSRFPASRTNSNDDDDD